MVLRPMAFLIIERTCNFAHQVPMFFSVGTFLNFICKVQWNTFRFLPECLKTCKIPKYWMCCWTHCRSVLPGFRVWSCSPLPFSTIFCSSYWHLPHYSEGVWQPLARQQKALLAREFYFEFTCNLNFWHCFLPQDQVPPFLWKSATLLNVYIHMDTPDKYGTGTDFKILLQNNHQDFARVCQRWIAHSSRVSKIRHARKGRSIDYIDIRKSLIVRVITL